MAEKDSISGVGDEAAPEHGRGHQPVGVAHQDRPLLAGALEGGLMIFSAVFSR